MVEQQQCTKENERMNRCSVCLVGGSVVGQSTASGGKLLVFLDRWEQRGGRRISADVTFLTGCVRRKKISRGGLKIACPLPPINSHTSTTSHRKVCGSCQIKPMQIYELLLSGHDSLFSLLFDL